MGLILGLLKFGKHHMSQVFVIVVSGIQSSSCNDI